MRIIWVHENLNRDPQAYSKFNLLVMFASVSLWKRNHPEDYTVIYVDPMTYELLERLGVISLWDEVIKIDFEKNFNKEVFWAGTKLQVLALQTEPCVIMDGDTLVFKPFKQHFKEGRVLVANYENGRGYYPTNLDPYVRKLSYRARWQTESCNVSFLYLPDPIFTQKYANLSIKFMEEFTKLKAPHSKYLIFAEQLLLRHLLDREKVEYIPIISTPWDCDKWQWESKPGEGIMSIEDRWNTFRHYGPLKAWYKKDDPDHPYKEETEMLLNCINFHTFIDLSSITRQ